MDINEQTRIYTCTCMFKPTFYRFKKERKIALIAVL